MARITPPFIFLTSKISKIIKPIIANIAVGVVKSPKPRTFFLALAIIIPAFLKPNNEIKSPIPALIEILILSGINFTIISLSPINEIITNRSPSQKITPEATAGDIPSPIIIETE